MKPATSQVLEELRANPSGITAMDALDAGCGDRLAARIAELKAEGHEITDHWETTPKGARVKRYALAATVRAGHPVGRVRTCPSCHGSHAVGTTCAWRATA